jgi:hypothetical protein
LVYLWRAVDAEGEVLVVLVQTALSRSWVLLVKKSINADDYLADLHHRLNAGFNIPSYCAYEKQAVWDDVAARNLHKRFVALVAPLDSIGRSVGGWGRGRSLASPDWFSQVCRILKKAAAALRDACLTLCVSSSRTISACKAAAASAERHYFESDDWGRNILVASFSQADP